GFKLAYAASLKNTGDVVTYIGDGASDVEAAMLAERVFARSTLLERLTGAHADVRPFETFHDVVASLNEG
ncbi:MAG: 2,3-diketo-5-methylthio-1-phosphopentane phosphatase, partial [Anaerolineaceae bacterium]